MQREKKHSRQVFIGFASKRDSTVRLIKSWMKEFPVNPVPWNTPGTIRNGRSIFTELVRHSNEAVAAVFIFAGDDQVTSKGRTSRQTRDNVLIEYGLFAGKLGVERVAAIFYTPAYQSPESLKVPSDMQGLHHIHVPRGKYEQAKKQFKAWLSDLLLEGQDKPPREVTSDDVGKEIQSLRETVKRSRPSKKVLKDPETEWTAGYLRWLLNWDSTRLCIRSQDTVVTLDRRGNVSSRTELNISAPKGKKVSVYWWSLLGDQPAKYSDVALQAKFVDTAGNETSDRVLQAVATDTDRRKDVVLIFDPPIQPGQGRRLVIEWKWPGILKNVIAGIPDTWEERFDSAQKVEHASVMFRLPTSSPRIKLIVRDPLLTKPPGKVDKNGMREDGHVVYRWVASKVRSSNKTFDLRPA